MDNAEITVDQTTVHIMLMIDEASRLLCPHFLFEHPADQSRNATGEEVVNGLQDSWIRHFGMPAKLRLDPEGAFRSNTLVQWCEERGIEVFPVCSRSTRTDRHCGKGYSDSEGHYKTNLAIWRDKSLGCHRTSMSDTQ